MDPNLRGVPRYQKANLRPKWATVVLNQESPLHSTLRGPGLFFPRQH